MGCFAQPEFRECAEDHGARLDRSDDSAGNLRFSTASRKAANRDFLCLEFQRRGFGLHLHRPAEVFRPRASRHVPASAWRSAADSGWASRMSSRMLKDVCLTMQAQAMASLIVSGGPSKPVPVRFVSFHRREIRRLEIDGLHAVRHGERSAGLFLGGFPGGVPCGILAEAVP